MNDVNLTDLDELAQQVRDKRSRTYIVEAINAYRGGAYRAAIVATWIAVIYDILLKLRELVKREIFQLTAEDLEKLKATKLKKGKDFPSTTVDELKALEDREFNNKNKFWQAVESCTSKPVTDECKGHILERAAPILIYLEEVETYIKEERIFKIEKDILPKAYEVFKLLTLHEYKDLERLREDRHQCAHPAFVAEETLFQPTPERVRMHIVYAVYHLLRYEPVRGEMAINQILHDIKQPSTFPAKYDDVLKFLNDRYFDSVKDDNFIPRLTIILLNKLLRNDDPELWGKEHSLILTLKFISQKYDNIYKKVITDELTSIVRALEEEQLIRVFYLLKAEQSCWYHLSVAERIRIKRLIEQKTKESNAADFFFNYKVFVSIHILKSDGMDLEAILELFEMLNQGQQEEIILDTLAFPNEKYIEKAIEFYSLADIDKRAEEIGEKFLVPLASRFSSSQVQEVLQWVTRIDNIAIAAKTPEILKQLFDKTIFHINQTKDLWKEVITYLEDIERQEETYDASPLREKLESHGIVSYFRESQ